MKHFIFAIIVGFVAARACASEPALTIYNQDFAVVRDSIRLDLKQGVNNISYNQATMHLEPDSVVLRDPTGQHILQILEQNFRADPISEGLLLSLNEGKTIEFESATTENGREQKKTIRGKIIRSGYVSGQSAPNPYSQIAGVSSSQPIIEVEGKLMFRLPGLPLFPALGDDSILKPTLTWQIASDISGAVNTELSYVTGGMNWHADYNLVAPETGDTLDLVGWVTIDNQSGKSFQNAKIKLMAGDVNKIQPQNFNGRFMLADQSASGFLGAPAVTEKSFDEYHLYTLARPATLLDRETKQVEFVRADGIKSHAIYVYDGVKIDPYRYSGWNYLNIRENSDYGTESNPKVSVMREFSNAESNHLGIPLPKGRLRFYRRDADGQMEFTGENTIDHTPRDEMIRVTTGNAFDIVGERKRTDYKVDSRAGWVDESFEITLRNHKKEPVEIRVVEHLYRWPSWEIKAKSAEFAKMDSNTVEFRIPVKAAGAETVTYTVHYSW